MIRHKLAMALVAASIAVASLSSVAAQSPSPRPSPAPSPSPGVDRERPQVGQMTEREAKDAQFVQTMVQHEERGIEMARLEEDQGSDTSVKRLATQLRRAQERRLTELQRVARSLPATPGSMDKDTETGSTAGRSSEDPADRQDSTQDSTTDPERESTTDTRREAAAERLGRTTSVERQGEAMLERLKSVSGEELDRAFLEEMAEHHRLSIHTAQLATLQNLDLDRLAQRILEEQRKELSQIEQQHATVSSKR